MRSGRKRSAGPIVLFGPAVLCGNQRNIFCHFSFSSNNRGFPVGGRMYVRSVVEADVLAGLAAVPPGPELSAAELVTFD